MMPPFMREATPAETAAIERYQNAVRQFQVDQRNMHTHWAALYCECPPWWRGPGIPPAADCIVHGQMLIGPKGEIL